MSKELSTLERFKNIKYAPAFFGIANDEELSKDCDIIEEALQRLEAIDNTTTSEALKAFEDFKDISLEGFVLITPDLQRLNTIKQALLKSQEQKNVLEIIMKRQVNIALLVTVKDVEEYNFYIPYEEFEKYLTQEEFDLLKRYCEND